MSNILDLYEPLDVIGNGSFGIIRKVKRKSDGLIFARKELYFERMSDRDKKQIVAEVNILKDLQHEHVVRYHDRHVDRDAGVLYILMEYCGGGDLTSVIKQAQRQNKPVSEELVWNYFMQILLALSHCHHPNGHSRSGSSGADGDGKDRRPQILHRDLKPDNVFLDENNRVKLGDFGLAKALAQASFAQTYVGTPYYMSPELMQEKAYDSKSDIWSLGCLIYELCALKPPFHEAKTHAELSILIRNGRIPPLPRGYSQALSNTIKAMLSQNPAMRPSAAQLLQHERVDLAFKVIEADKMIARIKTHKANVTAREQDLQTREASILSRETQLTALLVAKDSEIASLQHLVSTAEEQHQKVVDGRVGDAVARREEELRVLVMEHQLEVSAAMSKREEELLDAVKRREEEIREAWFAREQEVREEMAAAVEERMEWVRKQMEEVEVERKRLQTTRDEVEIKVKAMSDSNTAEKKTGRKEKTYLEEVKNVLAPLSRLTLSPDEINGTKPPPSHVKSAMFQTPLTRKVGRVPFDSAIAPLGSAMKGVVLTTTGETLATPSPTEFAKLFVATPKVGMNFQKIFDDEYEEENTEKPTASSEDDEPEVQDYKSDSNHLPTPSKPERRPSSTRLTKSSSISALKSGSTSSSSSLISAPPRARARRPSLIPTSQSRPQVTKDKATGSTSRASPSPVPQAHRSNSEPMAAPKPTTTASSSSAKTRTAPIAPAQYDLLDEENLPSPFLKRTEKRSTISSTGTTRDLQRKSSRLGGASAVTNSAKKKTSEQNILRAYAAANAAKTGVDVTVKS